MALISCAECGKQISDQATHCIHCGCPITHGGVLSVFFSTNFKFVETKSVLVKFDGKQVTLSKGQNHQFPVPADGKVHYGTIACGGMFSHNEKMFDFSLDPGENRNIVIDYNNLAFLPANRWECRHFIPR